MNRKPLPDRAAEFAARAHANQKRMYTGEPYFVHLHEVAMTVAEHGLGDNAIAAAYLHDVIEDQPVTYDDVRAEFGREIADMVQALTDTPKGPGINREQRKARDVARLAAASSDVQSIKCADLLSNTGTIAAFDPKFARKYLPEKRAILSVLTGAEGRLLDKAWAALTAAEAQIRAGLTK